jgi:hypothetical protein
MRKEDTDKWRYGDGEMRRYQSLPSGLSVLRPSLSVSTNFRVVANRSSGPLSTTIPGVYFGSKFKRFE